MKNSVRHVLAALFVLGLTDAVCAINLTANRDLSGGAVLTGTPDNVTAQIGGTTTNYYWWADKNGDGNANDPVNAGLNLAAFNLTRISDNVGFVLNLHDGTSPGAVTWGGVSGGELKTRHQLNDATRGLIAITNATDVGLWQINTCSGKSGSRGGAITISQTGNLVATNLYAYGENDGAGIGGGGAITCTGSGPAGGSLLVAGQIANYGKPTGASTLGPGPITISGYSGVTVGSGGIVSYRSANQGSMPALTITNIGAGGVTILGPLSHYETDGDNHAASPAPDVTISTAGSVQLIGIDTYISYSPGNWLKNHGPGNIIITAGGSVLAAGDFRTYLNSGGTEWKNAGAVTITAGGAVQLAGIDTHNSYNSTAYYAGDVQVTAGGDIALKGTVNLSAPSGGDRRGDLALTAAGSIALNLLDMTNANVVALDSGTGLNQITNALTNFSTNWIGGRGTFRAPYLTTQTRLRLPATQRIYYAYVPGVLNDYLGGYTYKVADLSGTAGAGGLLMVKPKAEGALISVR